LSASKRSFADLLNHGAEQAAEHKRAGHVACRDCSPTETQHRTLTEIAVNLKKRL